MTDLHTLFDPGETKIVFDEGWISLGSGPAPGDPRNLVSNGDFETGIDRPTAENPVAVLGHGSTDVDHWQVVQDGMNWTHESFIMDTNEYEGQRFADLSCANGRGAVSQVIRTEPNVLYHVWFSLGANPYGNLMDDAGKKGLMVSAAGTSEAFSFDSTGHVGPVPAEGSPWPVYWQQKTWHFVATDQTTTLTFANNNSDPKSSYGVAIDNVVVVPAQSASDDGTWALEVSVTDQGSVLVGSDDPPVGPEGMVRAYPAGEMVTLTAQESYAGHFTCGQV